MYLPCQASRPSYLDRLYLRGFANLQKKLLSDLFEFVCYTYISTILIRTANIFKYTLRKYSAFLR